MRGLGDHLSVGERIAFYRKRRGYTQEVLAGLVGRSTDWLAKIETGRRKPPRIDMLAELSRILRVPLGDLLGQTVLMEDERQHDDVPAVRDALMDLGGGCGLRQGEIFGLAVDAISFDSGWLHIANQVKVTKQGLVFAPPKRNKVREVPLPDHVAHILKRHIETFPPVEITLPWLRTDGPPVTKRLLFTRLDGAGAVRRTDFNVHTWKPALVAAGVIPQPRPGERHKAAREHGMHALRHFYASVLLDAGENIKALSSYLGHNDPGFTLRVYTHLMPSSDARARKAVDCLYRISGSCS